MGTYTATPRTWVALETVTAALMNSDVRDPLIALTAAWTSYTPTLAGFTAGNGTATGYYRQIGKTVDFVAIFTFGSSSAAATTTPTLTLPVTAARTPVPLTGIFVDASASLVYTACAYISGTTVAAVGVLGTNGARTNASTTSPFTWTTSDVVCAAGTYEAA